MLRPCLAATFVLGALLAPCRAVIVAGGDGTQNTTAPTGNNDFGFSNVGLVNGASGVYLGNGWVISGYHVVADGTGGFSFGNVVLAGGIYGVDPSTAVRLTQGGNTADLAVFRLSGPFPNLPSVVLSASTPGTQSTLYMMGNGLNREATETHWNIDTATTPDTWTVTAGTGNQQGYLYASDSSHALRWGTNKRTSEGVFNVDDGYGITRMFRSTFDIVNSDEAQAANGDSGGGVFSKNGANWELSGVMLGISHNTTTYDGQPGNAAINGDYTFMADIASYRTQILSIVPEPSSGLLVVIGVVALGSRRSRRKA